MKSLILHTPEITTLSETGIVTVVRAVANLCNTRPDVEYSFHETKDGMWELGFDYQNGTGELLRYIKCPFGQPGEVRWCKETVNISKWGGLWLLPNEQGAEVKAVYRADNFTDYFMLCYQERIKFKSGVRSSSTMPQWASRFNVECTSVKVEQVNGVWSWLNTYKRVE